MKEVPLLRTFDENQSLKGYDLQEDMYPFAPNEEPDTLCIGDDTIYQLCKDEEMGEYDYKIIV